MDCLVIDEFAQSSAEMLSILDMTLKRVRATNTYMSGMLIFFTLDYLQIQPVKGRPLMTSPAMIPCFQTMINLKTSVRAAADLNFRVFRKLQECHH